MWCGLRIISPIFMLSFDIGMSIFISCADIEPTPNTTAIKAAARIKFRFFIVLFPLFLMAPDEAGR